MTWQELLKVKLTDEELAIARKYAAKELQDYTKPVKPKIRVKKPRGRPRGSKYKPKNLTRRQQVQAGRKRLMHPVNWITALSREWDLKYATTLHNMKVYRKHEKKQGNKLLPLTQYMGAAPNNQKVYYNKLRLKYQAWSKANRKANLGKKKYSPLTRAAQILSEKTSAPGSLRPLSFNTAYQYLKYSKARKALEDNNIDMTNPEAIAEFLFELRQASPGTRAFPLTYQKKKPAKLSPKPKHEITGMGSDSSMPGGRITEAQLFLVDVLGFPADVAHNINISQGLTNLLNRRNYDKTTAHIKEENLTSLIMLAEQEKYQLALTGLEVLLRER